MKADDLRRIATQLETGVCHFVEVDIAMMLAYAVIGERAYPCAWLALIPDETDMMVLWLAVAILEDEERTQRIVYALDVLRREALR